MSLLQLNPSKQIPHRKQVFTCLSLAFSLTLTASAYAGPARHGKRPGNNGSPNLTQIEMAKEAKKAFLKTEFFKKNCVLRGPDSHIFCHLPALNTALIRQKAARETEAQNSSGNCSKPGATTSDGTPVQNDVQNGFPEVGHLLVNIPQSPATPEVHGGVGGDHPDDAWFLSASGADAGDPGGWELESTLSGTFQKGSRTFTGPMTEVSFTPNLPAIDSRVTLYLGTDGFSNQWNTGPGEKNLSGFGSVEFGARANLKDFERTGTKVGIDLSVEAPTNSQAIKNGFSDPHLVFVPTVLLQQDAGNGRSLFFNVGTELSSEGRGAVNLSVGLGQALNDAFTAYFGASGAFADPSQKGAIAALEAGLAVELKPGLRVGVGVQHTVSATGDYKSQSGTTVLIGTHSEF